MVRKPKKKVSKMSVSSIEKSDTNRTIGDIKASSTPIQPIPTATNITISPKRRNCILKCFSKVKTLFYDSIDCQDEIKEMNPDINHSKIIPNPSNELEQLINMVKIPFYLEKLMAFTLLASIDGLLYYFTVLPIKIIQRFCSYRWRGENVHYQQVCTTYKQRCTLFLIIIACIVLSYLDTSKVYHKIKRQNTMKLYMLFNVLEMCDKMLASIGQSLLNVLLSNVAAQHYRHDRKKQILFVTLSAFYLIAHGYILIFQSISLNVAVNSYNNSLLALLLSLQFAEIKGSIFKKIDKEGLFQLSISDIVQRFKIFLLLLIIIIRNTGAIINIDTLSITKLLNKISYKLVMGRIMKLIWSPLVSVFGSEIIIDWMKHSYITKFNRIRPEIYDKFYLIMYRDHKNASLSQFQERLGLPLPAFVVLFIVMVRPVIQKLIKDFITLNGWSYLVAISVQVTWMVTISFIILLFMRVITHSVLSKYGAVLLSVSCQLPHPKSYHIDKNTTTTTRVTESDYVPGEVVDGRGSMDAVTRATIYSGDDRVPASLVEKRAKHDRSTPEGLEVVARYQMVSKRIW